VVCMFRVRGMAKPRPWQLLCAIYDGSFLSRAHLQDFDKMVKEVSKPSLALD